MSEYISPLPVRIRRLELKREKNATRFNAIEKLTDHIQQAFKSGVITEVERDVALAVHKKILRERYIANYKMGQELSKLKAEHAGKDVKNVP